MVKAVLRRLNIPFCSSALLTFIALQASSLANHQSDLEFYDRVVERVFSIHAGNDFGLVVQFLDEQSEIQIVVDPSVSDQRSIRTMVCSPSVHSQLSSVQQASNLEDAVKMIRCNTANVAKARVKSAERVIDAASLATVDVSDAEFIVLDATRLRVEVRSASKSMRVTLSVPPNAETSSEPIVVWAMKLRRALGL